MQRLITGGVHSAGLLQKLGQHSALALAFKSEPTQCISLVSVSVGSQQVHPHCSSTFAWTGTSSSNDSKQSGNHDQLEMEDPF